MVCDGQEQVGFRRFLKVREMGLEPTRQRHRNLNPARLPIPPLAQVAIPERNAPDTQNPRCFHT